MWIIGDGNEMEQLKILFAKTGISDDIVLFGAKYGIEKEMLLGKSMKKGATNECNPLIFNTSIWWFRGGSNPRPAD